MDISITDLIISPDKFTKGTATPATIKYKGIISGLDQNSVEMKFTVEEESPVFLINEEEDEVKEISWKEDLTVKVEEYEQDIRVRVKNSASELTAVRVDIEGTTAKGKTSSDISSVFYK